MAVITVDHVNIFRNFNAVQSDKITKITSCKYQMFITISKKHFFQKVESTQFKSKIHWRVTALVSCYYLVVIAANIVSGFGALFWLFLLLLPLRVSSHPCETSQELLHHQAFAALHFSDKFDSNIIVSLNQCHSKQYKTPIPYPLTHYLLKHFTKPHFLDILDIFSLDMSRISSNQLTKFCLSSFYDIFAWACPKVKISRQILEEKVT